MEKRMRGAVQARNGSMAMWLCLPFLLGGVAGCMWSVSVCEQSGQELCRFLTEYLLAVQAAVPARDIFGSAVLGLLFWNGLLTLCLTSVGAAVLPVAFCVRGFLFSFSVGCFVQVFGVSGLGLAFTVLGVPAFFWGLSFFLIGYPCMERALCLCGLRANESGQSRLHFFVAGIVCLLFGCVVECFVVPELLLSVVRMIF